MALNIARVNVVLSMHRSINN